MHAYDRQEELRKRIRALSQAEDTVRRREQQVTIREEVLKLALSAGVGPDLLSTSTTDGNRLNSRYAGFRGSPADSYRFDTTATTFAQGEDVVNETLVDQLVWEAAAKVPVPPCTHTFLAELEDRATEVESLYQNLLSDREKMESKWRLIERKEQEVLAREQQLLGLVGGVEQLAESLREQKSATHDAAERQAEEETELVVWSRSMKEKEDALSQREQSLEDLRVELHRKSQSLEASIVEVARLKSEALAMKTETEGDQWRRRLKRLAVRGVQTELSGPVVVDYEAIYERGGSVDPGSLLHTDVGEPSSIVRLLSVSKGARDGADVGNGLLGRFSTGAEQHHNQQSLANTSATPPMVDAGGYADGPGERGGAYLDPPSSTHRFRSPPPPLHPAVSRHAPRVDPLDAAMQRSQSERSAIASIPRERVPAQYNSQGGAPQSERHSSPTGPSVDVDEGCSYAEFLEQGYFVGSDAVGSVHGSEGYRRRMRAEMQGLVSELEEEERVLQERRGGGGGSGGGRGKRPNRQELLVGESVGTNAARSDRTFARTTSTTGLQPSNQPTQIPPAPSYGDNRYRPAHTGDSTVSTATSHAIPSFIGNNAVERPKRGSITVADEVWPTPSISRIHASNSDDGNGSDDDDSIVPTVPPLGAGRVPPRWDGGRTVPLGEGRPRSLAAAYFSSTDGADEERNQRSEVHTDPKPTRFAGRLEGLDTQETGHQNSTVSTPVSFPAASQSHSPTNTRQATQSFPTETTAPRQEAEVQRAAAAELALPVVHQAAAPRSPLEMTNSGSSSVVGGPRSVRFVDGPGMVSIVVPASNQHLQLEGSDAVADQDVGGAYDPLPRGRLVHSPTPGGETGPTTTSGNEDYAPQQSTVEAVGFPVAGAASIMRRRSATGPILKASPYPTIVVDSSKFGMPPAAADDDSMSSRFQSASPVPFAEPQPARRSPPTPPTPFSMVDDPLGLDADAQVTPLHQLALQHRLGGGGANLGHNATAAGSRPGLPAAANRRRSSSMAW